MDACCNKASEWWGIPKQLIKKCFAVLPSAAPVLKLSEYLEYSVDQPIAVYHSAGLNEHSCQKQMEGCLEYTTEGSCDHLQVPNFWLCWVTGSLRPAWITLWKHWLAEQLCWSNQRLLLPCISSPAVAGRHFSAVLFQPSAVSNSRTSGKCGFCVFINPQRVCVPWAHLRFPVWAF